MDYIVHGILQTRILEWVAFPFSRLSSQPRSPALQADSLPAEPQGKPKNTGVGSLSLLSGSSWSRNQTRGLLHCRQILYQLSYQGSPHYSILQLKEKLLRILLAAPVVRTRNFHSHGPRFNPWLVRKLRSCKLHGSVKKKKKEIVYRMGKQDPTI